MKTPKGNQFPTQSGPPRSDQVRDMRLARTTLTERKLEAFENREYRKLLDSIEKGTNSEEYDAARESYAYTLDRIARIRRRQSQDSFDAIVRGMGKEDANLSNRAKLCIEFVATCSLFPAHLRKKVRLSCAAIRQFIVALEFRTPWTFDILVRERAERLRGFLMQDRPLIRSGENAIEQRNRILSQAEETEKREKERLETEKQEILVAQVNKLRERNRA